MWRLSSLTKDQTCTPCSRDTDSSPLDRQGRPSCARSVFECFSTFCDSTFQVHLNISPAPALESTISLRNLLVPLIGEEKIFASLSRVLYPWPSHLRSWSAPLPGIPQTGMNGPPSRLTVRVPLLSCRVPALERRMLKGQGPSVIGQCESPRKDRPPHCSSQLQSSDGFKERKKKSGLGYPKTS